MARFRIAAAGVVLVLVAAMAVADWLGPAGDERGPLLGAGTAAALEPFGACDEALAYFRDHAAELVGPYGLEIGHPHLGFDDVVVETLAGATGDASEGDLRAAPPAAAPAPGQDFSTTNVQEAGIDEADVVKTDGQFVYAVAAGRLHIVDVRTGTPSLLASVELDGGWGQELLLDDDRLLVLSAGDGAVLPVDVGGGAATSEHGGIASRLTLVDVSDPADPRVESTLTVDGRYVSTRMVGGIARVVLHSGPTALPFSFPEAERLEGEEEVSEDRWLAAEAEAAERHRTVVANSTLEHWLPAYRLAGPDGDVVAEGTLLDCTRISRPAEFSGLDMVSVLTVDLHGELTPTGAAGVVGAADIVYASPERLYVATSRWQPRPVPEATEPAADDLWPPDPDPVTTQLHVFDITDPTTATYVASGEVDGRLLNQWALSAHAGYLRVATTIGDAWGTQPSESQVVVLAEQGDRLVQVGQVGGLGVTERIYAVRFMGEIGFVVTFRETDPLYTLDLSDPTAPRVVGELKILGYSAYLHPFDDGLLLGVGQDATEEGRRLGVQVSLFDVSDLAAPVRRHQLSLGQGSSAVEYDHRAFLFWPATGLVVLPVERWQVGPADGVTDVFVGAVGLTVAAEGIAELGTVTHADPSAEPWAGAIQRSLVVGQRLYTVSDSGILASDLTSLAPVGWAAF